MTDTVLSLSAYIGRKGILAVGGGRQATYQVPVDVVDVKRAYGLLRFKVRQKQVGKPPVVEWVNASRVTLEAV